MKLWRNAIFYVYSQRHVSQANPSVEPNRWLLLDRCLAPPWMRRIWYSRQYNKSSLGLSGLRRTRPFQLDNRKTHGLIEHSNELLNLTKVESQIGGSGVRAQLESDRRQLPFAERVEQDRVDSLCCWWLAAAQCHCTKYLMGKDNGYNARMDHSEQRTEIKNTVHFELQLLKDISILFVSQRATGSEWAVDSLVQQFKWSTLTTSPWCRCLECQGASVN